MYTTFLSLRYLLRRRMSAIATLLAVIFGVATLFTVLSVMEGYRVKLRELVRGLESHLTLIGESPHWLEDVEATAETLLQIPHVDATAPFVETIAMFKSFGRFSYLELKGIDPLKEAEVGDLEKHLLRTKEELIETILKESSSTRPQLESKVQEVLDKKREPLSPGEIERLFSLEHRREMLRWANPKRVFAPDERIPSAIVVGLNMLLDRELFLGDEIKVITLSPPPQSQPLTESFVIAGAFKSGQYEVDSRTGLVKIEKMRSFLGLIDPETGQPRSHGLRIALDDYHHAADVQRVIIRTLSEATAGAKLPALLERAGEVPARLGAEDRIAAMAAEVDRRLKPPAENPDAAPEEVRAAALAAALAAVQRAVEALASPELAGRSRTRAETSYRLLLNELVDQKYGLIAEEHLLGGGPLQAVTLTWQESLMGLRRERPPADRQLDMAADRVVLETAWRDLHAAAQEIVGRGFLAQVRTWEDRQQVILQAVEREKRIVGFLVLLINAFIACLVLLTLVLLVIEKTRDIGVLLALGATTRGVVTIFLSTGLVLVTLGVALGLVVGYYFVENINLLHDTIFHLTGVRLFDPETYKMDQLPVTVTPSEVLLSILPSVLFGLLASLVPAVWASRHDPIKAIHYE